MIDNQLVTQENVALIDKDGNVNLATITETEINSYKSISNQLNENDANSILNYGAEIQNAIAKQNRKTNPFNLPFFIAKTIALLGDFIGAKFPLDSNKLNKITSDLTFEDTKARKVLEWKPNNVLDYYKK